MAILGARSLDFNSVPHFPLQAAHYPLHVKQENSSYFENSSTVAAAVIDDTSTSKRRCGCLRPPQ